MALIYDWISSNNASIDLKKNLQDDTLSKRKSGLHFCFLFLNWKALAGF